MPDTSTKEIGARVRKRREELGLTREKMAELAGLSVQFAASIELGKQRMTTESLAKVCRALNISADYILFGSDRPVPAHDLNAMLTPLDKREREQAEQLLAIFVHAVAKR
ncbi:MAG: helix-turn-helix transcriptional regulator [Clostridia bacterium]|nr:helix-turn-helix transcriptional regulator [Clostridia bacterium]